MEHAPVGITVLIRFLRRDFDQKSELYERNSSNIGKTFEVKYGIFYFGLWKTIKIMRFYGLFFKKSAMAHAPVGITVLIRSLRRDFDQKIGTLRTE